MSVYATSNLSIDLHTDRGTVRPVDGVSYHVDVGECLAIVGESGSGKTVLNFAPLGLMPPGVFADLFGSVQLDGVELVGRSDHELSRMRGKVACAIFQDPMTALNPARRIGKQLTEVCEMHMGDTAAQAEKRILDLMQLCGISDARSRLKQYPHELSGGLCQRVMIAMTVATEPKLLIADEPTTALDVTVQAQILSILKELRRRLGMAVILITHDIGVVAGSADRVAVMYAGRIVEQGPVDSVLLDPQHPYTKALIAAVPRPEDSVGARFRGLTGMPPALDRPIAGCAFAPRCEKAMDVCTQRRPLSLPTGRAEAACHLLTKTEAA